MSTVQTNGASAITSSSTVNDGGVVVNGGNVGADNPMTVSKSLATMADSGTGYGSVVVARDGGAADDGAGISTALTAGGTLAFQPSAAAGERNFLIRGAGTEDGNNEINNSASTLLTSPASEVRLRAVNTVHKIVKTNRVGSYSSTEFNVLAQPSTDFNPGRTKGAGAGNVSNFVQVADGTTAATDDAASPTRGVPGELTFMFGGARPTNTADGNAQDYKARDSYEA